MFCWNCGKEYTEAIKFCEACGVYIEDKEAKEEMILAETVFTSEDEKLLGRYGDRYIKDSMPFQTVKRVNMLLTDKCLYLKGPLLYTVDANKKTSRPGPITCEKIIKLRDIISVEFPKKTFSKKKCFEIIYAGRKVQFIVNKEDELEAENFLEKIEKAREEAVCTVQNVVKN